MSKDSEGYKKLEATTNEIEMYKLTMKVVATRLYSIQEMPHVEEVVKFLADKISSLEVTDEATESKDSGSSDTDKV